MGVDNRFGFYVRIDSVRGTERTNAAGFSSKGHEFGTREEAKKAGEIAAETSYRGECFEVVVRPSIFNKNSRD